MPAFSGDVLEASVAEIVVENVAIHAGHEQIHVTVVVIVSGRGAHRVSCARHAAPPR